MKTLADEIVESGEECDHVKPLESSRVATNAARRQWRETPLKQRLLVIRRLRQSLALGAEKLADLVTLPQRTSKSETIAAEIAPLVDACRFLERNASRILQTKVYGNWRRWLGMGGVAFSIQREPVGVILILGPGNYPLFLAGVQTLQALVAGNGVELKPGQGAFGVLSHFVEMLQEAGLPPYVVRIWDESQAAGRMAVQTGADKVILTGSAETGRIVLSQLAQDATPAVMELSGCDAMIVLESADLDRAAKALAFGLRLNNGATCIAPRRILVHAKRALEFQSNLQERIAELPPGPAPQSLIERGWRLIDALVDEGAEILAGGAKPLSRDLFPPTIIRHHSTSAADDLFLPLAICQTVATDAEAVNVANQSVYGLGASVFGEPHAAQYIAKQLRVGTVTINDLIAPTADARFPFAARGASGFGVTRGAAGLLEMTQLKVVAVRHGSWLPHLESPHPQDSELLAAWLRLTNAASLGHRWKAGIQLLSALRGRTSASPRRTKETP